MEDAVDVGHPLYEKAGIDVWMSTFTGILLADERFHSSTNSSD